MLYLFIIVIALESTDISLEEEACGFHCLFAIATFVGVKADRLYTMLPVDEGPFSYNELSSAASALGCATRLVRWREQTSAVFPCPAILLVRRPTSLNPDHFIVCFGEVGDRILVVDYPRKPVIISRAQLAEIWGGEALYIDRPDSQAFQRLKARPHFGLWVLGGVIATLFSIVFWRLSAAPKTISSLQQ